jgi:hypothetical protein
MEITADIECTYVCLQTWCHPCNFHAVKLWASGEKETDLEEYEEKEKRNDCQQEETT